MDLKNKKQLRWLVLGLLIAGATGLLMACGGDDPAPAATAPTPPAPRSYTNTILPLFNTGDKFFPGSPACDSCHNGITTTSAHQMDLSSFSGLLMGADLIAQTAAGLPPVDLLGRADACYDGSWDKANGAWSTPPDLTSTGCTPNWNKSKMRSRLRDARMPPNWPFMDNEGNRDTREIGVVGAWVGAGAQETQGATGKVSYDTLLTDLVDCEQSVDADGNAATTNDITVTVVTNVVKPCVAPVVTAPATSSVVELPIVVGATTANWVVAPAATAKVGGLFTTDGVFFSGSQKCDGCHTGVVKASAHEMGLGTYADIIAGADGVSKPVAVDILGRPDSCADGVMNAAGTAWTTPPDLLGACAPNWGASKLKARLRNTRMPPGWTFQLDESNRDTPEVVEIQKWMGMGMPEGTY